LEYGPVSSTQPESNSEGEDFLASHGFTPRVDADYLQFAVSNKKIFDAHVEAGFSRKEAIQITAQAVGIIMMGQMGMSTDEA
jgi:hypothetical protein